MAKKSMNVEDVLNNVGTSDSEFEELSDNDESQDADWDGNEQPVSSYESDTSEWSDSDDEPLIKARKSSEGRKQKDQYRFESRRQYVPPNNTDFVPGPIEPPPEELTPYQYFQRFVTTEMLEAVILETNKLPLRKEKS